MNAAPKQPESMNIEFRLVAELLPYARNSKNHSPDQVEIIAGSIQRFGWTNPCLIADGVIIAGHGRIMAAKKLGLLRVPCIDVSHLSESDRRAYVIMDNRSAETGASWDLEMLKLETDDLRAMGIDLEAATGFSEEDLAKLFEGMEEPEKGEGKDPEAVPPTPEVPHSRLGDIWCIGEHRVMCGSSLEHADWDRLMEGEQADVVWTDPPYNVDIGEKNAALDRADGGNRSKKGGIKSDAMDDKAFYQFLLSMYSAVFDQMKPGAPIYVFHADSEGINFRTAFRDAGFKLQSVLSWRKNQFVLSRWDHHPITEPCLYGWKPGAAHKWYGGRKQTTFSELGDASPFQQQEDGSWAVTVGDEIFIVSGDARVEVAQSAMITEPKPARSDLHPTMKPVNLVSRQLRNSARPGCLVLDAFGGSGSTAVAAHQCGMRSRLMELDPKYVDVIVMRLQMFTGIRAVHAVTGELFPTEDETRPEFPPVAPAAAPAADADLF